MWRETPLELIFLKENLFIDLYEMIVRFNLIYMTRKLVKGTGTYLGINQKYKALGCGGVSQLSNKKMLLLWIFSPNYVMLRQSKINILEVHIINHIIKVVHSQVIINCNPCGCTINLAIRFLIS